MQSGRRVRVRAGSGCATGDPNQLLWTGALAQNAGAQARILLPQAIAAGGSAQAIIKDIQVVGVDNLLWEFWFWSDSKFTQFRGLYAFAAIGLQIGAAGNYYAAHSTALDIFYEDDDAQTAVPPAPGSRDAAWRATSNGQTGAYLNVTLVNRSAGGKTSGGYFDVTFILEPTQGQ